MWPTKHSGANYMRTSLEGIQKQIINKPPWDTCTHTISHPLVQKMWLEFWVHPNVNLVKGKTTPFGGTKRSPRALLYDKLSWHVSSHSHVCLLNACQSSWIIDRWLWGINFLLYLRTMLIRHQLERVSWVTPPQKCWTLSRIGTYRFTSIPTLWQWIQNCRKG